LTGLGINTNSIIILFSRQKRKGNKEFVDNNNRKRSRLIENWFNIIDINITVNAEKHELNTTSHYSIQESEPNSLAGYKSETYGNRIYYYLVASLAGRPFYVYKSVREFLEALYDIILGHKLLLEDKKILYRDISKNNIIITKTITNLVRDLDYLRSRASY
jgi:hypothetical protein